MIKTAIWFLIMMILKLYFHPVLCGYGIFICIFWSIIFYSSISTIIILWIHEFYLYHKKNKIENNKKKIK